MGSVSPRTVSYPPCGFWLRCYFWKPSQSLQRRVSALPLYSQSFSALALASLYCEVSPPPDRNYGPVPATQTTLINLCE